MSDNVVNMGAYKKKKKAKQFSEYVMEMERSLRGYECEFCGSNNFILRATGAHCGNDECDGAYSYEDVLISLGVL